jgi:hypothetical protein
MIANCDFVGYTSETIVLGTTDMNVLYLGGVIGIIEIMRAIAITGIMEINRGISWRERHQGWIVIEVEPDYQLCCLDLQ